MMDEKKALNNILDRRFSCRSFTNKPVSRKIIEDILSTAQKIPSWCNAQPWTVTICSGKILNNLSNKLLEAADKGKTNSDIPFPVKYEGIYRERRKECGLQLYNSIGIEKGDHHKAKLQMHENFKFFGAPCAFFCFVDRQMGPPQWSDLGMFLQTFMLLAQEAGIDTCAQEAWAIKNESVSEFVGSDKSDILFCGLAMGFKDEDAVINQLSSERRPIKQWAKFL